MSEKINQIIDVDILDESKQCFLDYAKEVLEDRAIPDAKDGLLRVHRELLWTMEEVLKMSNESGYKKSASIVGSTLASSYFHGDSSCYNAMCKLSLPFLMRYPLVDGKGSLGTQESNDMQAAARYTNARPSKITDLMMEDYNKKIVDVKPTYNNEYMEPIALPSLFPNAICNGRQAIGVSMAHNSMPHNLSEVCDAIVAFIKNKGNMSVEELMEYIKGPDFPLGGVVINEKDIKKAYKTGKSDVSLKIRGDYKIEGDKIIFTSIPYRVTRSAIREQINKNVEELGRYITDFNDESSVGNNKLVFSVNSKDNIDKALNLLFQYTDLQSTCSFNMNFIVDGSPKLCSMVDLISTYVKHQKEILIRGAQFDKAKAEKKIHILTCLLVALKYIDEIITIIKSSNNKPDARSNLDKFFQEKGHAFDEEQLNSILDIRLVKLTKLDKSDLEKELEENKKIYENCVLIIENDDYRSEKLIAKVEKMKKEYGDARRTKLTNITVESLKKTKKEIPSTVVYVSLANHGKSLKLSQTKIKDAIKTSMDATLELFTKDGFCYKIPVIKLTEKINSLKELLKTDIEDVLLITDTKFTGDLLTLTSLGMIKKTSNTEFNSNRSTKAIKLKDGDTVVNVYLLNTEKWVSLDTKEKYHLSFSIEDIACTGKNAMGVKGINLHEEDNVVKTDLLSVCPKDLGKRNKVGKKK